MPNEALTISLAAVTGIQSPLAQTIRVATRVHNQDFVALLDSGSTHNFIVDSAVATTNIPLRGHDDIQVMVTNGDRVSGVGLCRGLTMTINDDNFTLDFFANPLAGVDLVLGVQ